MPIYDLNQTYYLWQDIEDVIERIDLFYAIENKNGKLFIQTKTKVSAQHHWTSEECQNAFNKLIPKIKSLHKDMYGLIEAIYKHNNNNSFDKKILANSYQNFDEFRLLNNKFKHFTSGEKEINLTSLVMMGTDFHLIDIYCNFKHPNGELNVIRYPEFIETFLLFLESNNLITFK